MLLIDTAPSISLWGRVFGYNGNENENTTQIGALMKKLRTFAERLRYVRLLREMSQTDLATRLNTYQSCIARWEKEQRKPTIESIDKLAKILAVPPAWLAFGGTLALRELCGK